MTTNEDMYCTIAVCIAFAFAFIYDCMQYNRRNRHIDK